MTPWRQPDEGVERDEQERGEDEGEGEDTLVHGGEEAGPEAVVYGAVPAQDAIDGRLELPLAVQADDGQGEQAGDHHDGHDGGAGLVEVELGFEGSADFPVF